MKDFRKNIDKKVWGVLGKQQTYYSPAKFLGEKVPLNANPLDSWDVKRSRFRRVDLVPRPNDGQQGGVVPQDTTPSVSPTPQLTPSITPTLTNTPTPSITPTLTNTPTPSSTPAVLNWENQNINWESDTDNWENA